MKMEMEMKTRRRTLSCFRDFRCQAGDCQDTCCAGWEIDLDEKILKIYAELPGTLGEEIRDAIREEDGYTFFGCQDGRCPFLNEQNLCRLILDSLSRGQPEEELLSEVCREHPRFYDVYGDLTETSLSISCPEAARLLLQQAAVSVLTERMPETGNADEPNPELEIELRDILEKARQQFFRLAMCGEPFQSRLSNLMKTAAVLQNLLDNRQIGVESGKQFPLPECREMREMPENWRPDLGDWLLAMDGMEFTDDRLPALIRARKACAMPDAPSYPVFPEEQRIPIQNLLVYFLFRYVLRAVWDEDVLSKVGLAVRSVETIAFLAERTDLPPEEALQRAAVLYSREVEHSDENLDLLYDVVWKEYLG